MEFRDGFRGSGKWHGSSRSQCGSAAGADFALAFDHAGELACVSRDGGTAIASVWCWAVIIEKYFAVRRMNSPMTGLSKASGLANRSRISISPLERAPTGPLGHLHGGHAEWKRSQMRPCGQASRACKKRIEKVVDVQIQKEMSTIESRLLFLATTGAAALLSGCSERCGAS